MGFSKEFSGCNGERAGLETVNLFPPRMGPPGLNLQFLVSAEWLIPDTYRKRHRMRLPVVRDIRETL